MPRSRYTFRDDRFPHFITSTVLEWLPVFTSGKACQILTDAFDFLRQRHGLKLYAWVILDNHVHAIVAGENLNKMISSWRSHTAREIIRHLQTEGQAWALNRLAYTRTRERKSATDRESPRYQLWRDGVHPQLLDSDAMFDQKLDYIHNNPVMRGLVSVPEHWKWSSAHAWLPNVRPVLRCDNYHQPEWDSREGPRNCDDSAEPPIR